MKQNDVKIYLERTGTKAQLIYTPLNLFNTTRFHFLRNLNLCQIFVDFYPR